jgi:hypothetical protein
VSISEWLLSRAAGHTDSGAFFRLRQRRRRDYRPNRSFVEGQPEMAKQKKMQPPPETERAKTHAAPPPKKSTGREQPFPLYGYVVLNLMFWAFCGIEILLVKWWLNDIKGVFFFFVLLALGFTAVSVYDFLYDRVIAPVPAATGDGSPSEATR